MLISPKSQRGLAAFATVCLLSVALPTAPAWAQKTKDKTPAATETTSPDADTAPSATAVSEFAVDIPTIDAEASNVDEDTLRAIFSGEIVDNAQALAGLTATSITIPAINITGTTTTDGESTDVTVTFTDIVLSDVVDGSAASISLGDVTSENNENTASFGPVSAANFNIGGVLGLYGLVNTGAQTELETIYTDFSFEGGTVTGPEVECAVGAASADEFRARPLKYSFPEIMTVLSELEKTDGGTPDPKLTGDALRMYVDLLTAFQSSPLTFDGFECSGTDEQNRPIVFSVDSMAMDGMAPGYYPAFTMDGLNVEIEGDGTIGVGSLTMKGMDISGPIAAILAAPEAIDDAWFEANVRSLVPSWEGFSFSNVTVDVPNTAMPAERVVAGIGDFDLSLGGYLNGIPTTLSSAATNITVEIPENTQDPQYAQLKALGISTVDLGFGIDVAWNEANSQIDINNISVTGVDLATVKLSGTIANVTAALFGVDSNAALDAAMSLAIANIKADVTDLGLSDVILQQAAAQQGTDAATMRPMLGGLAEGTVLGILAGAAEAQKVGTAINTFVSGKAKNLVIDMVAKQQPGLSFLDFAAAESDPTVLIGKVNITATAK